MGDVIRLGDRRAGGAAADRRGAAIGAAPHRPAATPVLAAPYFPGGAREDGAARAGAKAGAKAGASGARRAAAALWHPVHGAESAHSGGGNGAPFDAELVVARLEAAGRTLLALPGTGYSTGLRVSRLEIVRSALEAFGAECGPVRAAVPSAAQISQMDEALGWISLIPVETVARGRPGGGHVLRRIVGARALVGPVTERHVYSWRRLGGVLGADHKAVQRWHAQAIGLIVAALNRLGGSSRLG